MVTLQRKTASRRSWFKITTLVVAFLICFGGLALLFQWSQTETDDDNTTTNWLGLPPPLAAVEASPGEEDAYSLAKEQSFGYFTDITNDNWRIAQKHHASLFPNYHADLTKYTNSP